MQASEFSNEKVTGPHQIFRGPLLGKDEQIGPLGTKHGGLLNGYTIQLENRQRLDLWLGKLLERNLGYVPTCPKGLCNSLRRVGAEFEQLV